MSREFRLPSLGADMEEATLVEWKVASGSRVRAGDVVAIIETDKGLIDLESFLEGEVERLVVEPGTKVPVGSAIAVFSGEPEPELERTAPPAAPPVPSAAESPGEHAAIPAVQGPSASPSPPSRAVRLSPAARRRAEQLGIDPTLVQPTGPGGSVTLQDIERAAAASGEARSEHGQATIARPKAEASPPAAVPGTLRDAIASAMARSKREIPHYYVHLQMDASRLTGWLAEFNAVRPPTERLLAAVLYVRAVALAARALPDFNGTFEGGALRRASQVNVGVAIALPGGGVIAPALLDADRKPAPLLMGELRELVERARHGRLRSGELAGGTITVTSLGEEGVDSITPIIQPPQVAIVGIGSVLERPWAEEGRVDARPVLCLSLAGDHRVTDGRGGARFLAAVRGALQHPETL